MPFKDPGFFRPLYRFWSRADLVPFAGSRRKMTDGDDQSCLPGQLLKLPLPESETRTVLEKGERRSDVADVSVLSGFFDPVRRCCRRLGADLSDARPEAWLSPPLLDRTAFDRGECEAARRS